jgi:DNA repair exonuclease SbcCD ATPase subunit
VAKDGEFKEYTAVVAAHNAAMRLWQSCNAFATADYATVPPTVTWTGPDVSQPAPANPLADLQRAEQQVALYQRELGRQQQAQAAMDAAQLAVEKALQAESEARLLTEGAQATLDQAATATSELFTVEHAFKTAEQAVKDAQRELETAQRMFEMRRAARQQIEDQLAAAQKELAGMQFNNVLVDTLRKARPSIVEELWNMVSATVSDTFSRIRGTPSVFMRDGDSFTVDGRAIKGLSGSTLDALGLSIRMGLTKTFLPNTRFLVLDEPAAAADSDRESNMLGVIAASEFEQVILVTHSELCDSFASQMIRL